MSTNKSLYEDKHPKKSLKGLGFKDAEKASYTLNKIKDLPLSYQIQIVTTMFNRAKYHPYKNDNMIKAMKIYAVWMKKYKIKYSFK
jgi:hypothetical protein